MAHQPPKRHAIANSESSIGRHCRDSRPHRVNPLLLMNDRVPETYSNIPEYDLHKKASHRDAKLGCCSILARIDATFYRQDGK